MEPAKFKQKRGFALFLVFIVSFLEGGTSVKKVWKKFQTICQATEH